MSKETQELERLRAENEALKQANVELKANRSKRGLGFKVAEKGGISLYGLGRWPVTLYYSQWVRLAVFVADNFAAWVEENRNTVNEKSGKGIVFDRDAE